MTRRARQANLSDLERSTNQPYASVTFTVEILGTIRVNLVCSTSNVETSVFIPPTAPLLRCQDFIGQRQVSWYPGKACLACDRHVSRTFKTGQVTYTSCGSGGVDRAMLQEVLEACKLVGDFLDDSDRSVLPCTNTQTREDLLDVLAGSARSPAGHCPFLTGDAGLFSHGYKNSQP